MVARSVSFWLFGIGLLSWTGDGRANPLPEESVTPVAPQTSSPDRKQQVRAALTWLVNNQEKDGRWKCGLGENRPALVATTSFCGLALLAAGDRQYYPAIQRAANYVTGNLFKEPIGDQLPEQWDQSNWKIALGGVFLCEFYATMKRDSSARSPQMEKLLSNVVKEGIRRMEPSGGWGHTPKVKNPLGYVELEVMSNWMLITLGTARELGIAVSDEDVERAVRYVEECCEGGQGGVGYSTEKDLREFGCPCRTGGAIFALSLLKKERRPIYSRMVTFWRRELRNSGEGHGSVALGLLASGLAARQVSARDWDTFQKEFFPRVLAAARDDGSFGHLTGKTPLSAGCDEHLGTAYNTGLYTLLLQLDGGYLGFLGRKKP